MKNHILRPRIGIIGGAGPIAGALLFQKVIQLCQEKYNCQQDADFPYIMLLSYPFADMLHNPSEEQKKLVKEQLNDCILRLVQNEVEIAVIACNTLHEFLDPLAAQRISFVHLIDETGSFVKQSQVSDTLVLCTTTSARCRLHQKYFECSYPDGNFQTQIQDLIDKILAGKQCDQDAKRLSERLNELLSQKEKEKIGLVLGCTEFSVFNEQFPLRSNGLSDRFLVFDPNVIVAEKICSLIFKNKKY